MGKMVKNDGSKHPDLYGGEKVYLTPEYGKGVRYCVSPLSDGYYLIATNKAEYNEGRGYIYGSWAIDRYEIFE